MNTIWYILQKMVQKAQITINDARSATTQK